MKKGIKTLLLYLVMIAAVVLAVVYISGSGKEEPQYSEIIDLFENKEVGRFEVSNSNVLTIYKWKDKEANIVEEKAYKSFKLRSL